MTVGVKMEDNRGEVGGLPANSAPSRSVDAESRNHADSD
jgi:hypothetical protein